MMSKSDSTLAPDPFANLPLIRNGYASAREAGRYSCLLLAHSEEVVPY